MAGDTNTAGRPTVMTELVLAKLEVAFSIGATDREACITAGIDTATLYRYCEDHPEFATRKELLKDMPRYQAKKVIVEALHKDDKDMAKWYGETKMKDEFSKRLETTGKDGKDLIPEVSPDALALANELNELYKRNKQDIGGNGASADTLDTKAQD